MYMPQSIHLNVIHTPKPVWSFIQKLDIHHILAASFRINLPNRKTIQQICISNKPKFKCVCPEKIPSSNVQHPSQ